MANASDAKRIYQIFSWACLGVIVFIVVLVLHKSPQQNVAYDPAAAARVQQKFAAADQAKAAGQPAKVSIDAIPGKHYKAHVTGIGAGTGSQFSLLPAQNATGNWVKVTQRVPVRLKLDDVPDRPLVAGWSANVTVDVTKSGNQ